MTTKEIRQAKRALEDRVDRVETIALDTGGHALTAYWLDGGQTLFYSIRDVEEHLASHGGMDEIQ